MVLDSFGEAITRADLLTEIITRTDSLGEVTDRAYLLKKTIPSTDYFGEATDRMGLECPMVVTPSTRRIAEHQGSLYDRRQIVVSVSPSAQRRAPQGFGFVLSLTKDTRRWEENTR